MHEFLRMDARDEAHCGLCDDIDGLKHKNMSRNAIQSKLTFAFFEIHYGYVLSLYRGFSRIANIVLRTSLRMMTEMGDVRIQKPASEEYPK